jgi:hypothetical protein
MLRGSWEPQLLAAAAPALPGATEGLDLLLLPAATARAPTTTAAKTALQDYKRLCDVLLPALRARSHLFNLIYRHRANHSLVLRHAGRVLGGATFHIVLAPDGSTLVLEVLLLCVEQREGVCGKGHGTRLINAAKALLLEQASLQRARPLMLTQCDIGLQARLFWTRQRLRACDEASRLVRTLHDCGGGHLVYDHTVAMSVELQPGGIVAQACSEHESARAQDLAEEAEEEEAVLCHACGGGGGGGAGSLLLCDLCSRWCHAGGCPGETGGVATGEADTGGEAEAFSCAECRALLEARERGVDHEGERRGALPNPLGRHFEEAAEASGAAGEAEALVEVEEVDGAAEGQEEVIEIEEEEASHRYYVDGVEAKDAARAVRVARGLDAAVAAAAAPRRAAERRRAAAMEAEAVASHPPTPPASEPAASGHAASPEATESATESAAAEPSAPLSCLLPKYTVPSTAIASAPPLRIAARNPLADLLGGSPSRSGPHSSSSPALGPHAPTAAPAYAAAAAAATATAATASSSPSSHSSSAAAASFSAGRAPAQPRRGRGATQEAGRERLLLGLWAELLYALNARRASRQAASTATAASSAAASASRASEQRRLTPGRPEMSPEDVDEDAEADVEADVEADPMAAAWRLRSKSLLAGGAGCASCSSCSAARGTGAGGGAGGRSGRGGRGGREQRGGRSAVMPRRAAGAAGAAPPARPAAGSDQRGDSAHDRAVRLFAAAEADNQRRAISSGRHDPARLFAAAESRSGSESGGERRAERRMEGRAAPHSGAARASLTRLLDGNFMGGAGRGAGRMGGGGSDPTVASSYTPPSPLPLPQAAATAHESLEMRVAREDEAAAQHGHSALSTAAAALAASRRPGGPPVCSRLPSEPKGSAHDKRRLRRRGGACSHSRRYHCIWPSRLRWWAGCTTPPPSTLWRPSRRRDCGCCPSWAHASATNALPWPWCGAVCSAGSAVGYRLRQRRHHAVLPRLAHRLLTHPGWAVRPARRAGSACRYWAYCGWWRRMCSLGTCDSRVASAGSC